MVDRATAPTEYKHCRISLATEQMRDGRWGVVATVLHATEGSLTPVPVPLGDQTFESEAAAREFGLQRAQEWIDHNTPRV